MNSSIKRIVLLTGLLALFMHSAFAHTYLSSVYLNNQLLSEGDCVRPHPSTAFDSPIPLVTSPDMTCGWLPNAAQAANRKCPIAAGSSIGIQWHHNSNSASDDIVDPTHKGPVIVYLAKSDTGAGNVWFKIFEDGYTASDGKWGVDRMLAKRGRVDITIPSDIAPGNYLLRGEIIALHGAYDVNGVQPYVGCVELTITSSGNANPSGVALPGYYKPTDPGMLINIYQPISSYVIPGPAVYRSGSSGSSSSGSSSGAPTSAPTTRPPTSSPTSTPTSAPTSSPSGGNIKVQMNGGTNVWWFAVAVSGGSEATSKVEFMDSRSVSSWSALNLESYGYVFSQSVQLTPPFSLRLTSVTGKQLVLQNVFTAFSSLSLIDTGKNYGSSSTPTSAPPTSAPTSAPTAAPPTTAPTTRPTTAPTTRPTDAPSSGNTVKLTQHTGTNAWWFAVAVSGTDAARIASVELRDSGAVANFAFLTSTDWGYYVFDTRGTALVAPITVRVTAESGKSVTGTLSAIAPGAVVDTRASL